MQRTAGRDFFRPHSRPIRVGGAGRAACRGRTAPPGGPASAAADVQARRRTTWSGGVGSPDARSRACECVGAAEALTGHATLEPGAEGTEVLDLQEGLAALGYDVGGADGVYGNATANAVAAFQSAEGLPVDGVLGPATREALSTVVTTRLQEEATPIRRGLPAVALDGRLAILSPPRRRSSAGRALHS